MFGNKKSKRRLKKDKFNTDYLEQLRQKNSTGDKRGAQQADSHTAQGEGGENGTVEIPDSNELQSSMSIEKPEVKTTDQKKDYIENCCDRIVTAGKRMDELKIEYQAVNHYLNDIHLIENMPDPQKEQLLGYAKKVVVLEKDRKDFGRSMSKLTNQQYSHMRECEDNIRDILKNIADDEKYCETVKTDMRYLEGERAALIFEKKEMKNRLYIINGASKIGIAAFAAAFIFLMVLGIGYGADVSLFMYGLVAIAAVFIGIIFGMYNKTVYELKLAEARLNKAITLLNKVKIKYVNVVSRLEYAYEKHGVKSAYQLNKLWSVYLKLQKEHEVYNKASNRLIEAEESLVALLKQMDIRDSNVWVSQAYAIVDRREMEEIKTSLNKRRHKLKTSLDYNNNTILKAKEEIKMLILGDKEHARELMAVMDAYDI